MKDAIRQNAISDKTNSNRIIVICRGIHSVTGRIYAYATKVSDAHGYGNGDSCHVESTHKFHSLFIPLLSYCILHLHITICSS